MKRTSIVMTKTSPIVAAALSQAEEEDFDTVDKKITAENSQKKLMLKQVHESMDSLKSQLLQKGVTEVAPQEKTSPQLARDYAMEKQNQEEKRAELLKREQEAIKLEKQKIEEEKERLRLEAEQLRIERELIYMATKAKSSACQIAATSGTTSSSTSSTCSANDQLDTDYSTSNMTPTDPADQYKVLNQFSCQGNRASSPKSIPIIFPNNYNENKYSKLRDYQNIEPQQSTLPQQWLIEEAERQRNAKLANTNSIHIASAEQKQKHRRSVPNMNQIMDQGNNYQNMQYSTNYQNIGYVNQLIPSNTAPAVSRIYEKQRGNKSSTASRSQQQQPKYQPRHANTQLTPNPYMAKPPASRSQISTSQTDLKHKKNLSSKSSHQQQSLSNSTSSLSGSKGGPPVISLNQKCSCCAQVLGQGSAMFIEKLGLAFHLKCFRCSVCNVPLGNGKEGTDVRVSVTNRLHCNNCFSNDLGKIYFNFNFIHCDFATSPFEERNKSKTQNRCNIFDSVSESSFKNHSHVDLNAKTKSTTKMTATTKTLLHLNYENKPEVYYRMYKMPLNKKQADPPKFVSDDYLIIPNYINLDPSSTALNTTSTKRHSSSYRHSFTNTFF